MTEQEITDVNMGDVDPNVGNEPSTQLDEHHEEVNSDVADDQGQDQESNKEINFKAVREQLRVMELEKQRIAQERDEYKDALISSVKPKAPEPEPEVDELDSIDPDDWTTRKHVEKLAERKAQVMIEKALKAEREQRYKEKLPDMIKKQFADFDDVVTKENIKYLKANKPHIATILSATTDEYSQAISAYEYIKAYCPDAKVHEDKQKAEINSKKPGSLGMSDSPLSQAKMFESGRLTPDLKRKLQQEMIAAARGS